VLSITWRVISTFLDEVTKKKIQIISDRSKWLPALLELMDDDQIPVQYGGVLMNDARLSNTTTQR
jgi:hypothetical protein